MQVFLKILIGIALHQTAPDLGLHCLNMTFFNFGVQNCRTFTLNIIAKISKIITILRKKIRMVQLVQDTLV